MYGTESGSGSGGQSTLMCCKERHEIHSWSWFQTHYGLKIRVIYFAFLGSKKWLINDHAASHFQTIHYSTHLTSIASLLPYILYLSPLLAMTSLFAEIGLSVAFTLISLAPMVPDLFKGAPPGPQTRINVMAGLPKLSQEQQQNQQTREQAYQDMSYGGCAPDVSLFNTNGDRVGFYRNICNNDKEGDHINQNNIKDLWADYTTKGNTEKAEYITVSASGIDAICISAITVSFPNAGDTYAFLPGEVAAVCKDHNPKYDFHWSESEATIQFADPKTGTSAIARPKCLWIDKADKQGAKATKYQGFQVHLIDFKLDNSTWAAWEKDPTHMCDSMARFGGYETLNVMMCPQIFSPGPQAGEMLPLNEISGCLPSAVPDKDGKVYSDPCDYPYLSQQDRYNILSMYKYSCPTDHKHDWFWDCPPDKKNGCGKPREPTKPIINLKDRRRAELPMNDGYPSADHPLQRRFAGKLVKSRDITQSAVRVCNSKGSVGPDFFSEHEQMFCDMNNRQLYTACRDHEELDCFDPVYNETRHRAVEKRQEQRVYLDVQDWL
jgi:hypothetical protein